MGQLYDLGGNSPWVFVVVTCLLGGAGAFVSGRAMAQTWRPYWQVPLYMLGIAAGVRFIHHALFDEVLLSLENFAVDFVVVVVAASAGYRLVRADQIARQYGWLFERAGLFGWRRKA
ncbi:MAG: hypothetical protein J2P50_05425 [Hyphomicrobiaceae bacterium]|nr:hypothetical protein [Hyphomicrobiaceae bacterium]